MDGEMKQGEKLLTLEDAASTVDHLLKKIAESIFGQEDLIHEAVCCLIAGGHVLITGAPGLAKTSLVRVIGNHLGLSFGRVQFTPDLLPSDIIGSEILDTDPQTGKRLFNFSKGPIFTNLLLADEINRASPRTQSALLEAMQERTCTVAGVVHTLPQPFMVFATQNPFDSEGTFPLPEAQMDRFLVHSIVDYPNKAAEEKIFSEHVRGRLVGEQRSLGGISSSPTGCIDVETINRMLQTAGFIKVEDEMVHVIMELVRSTRPEGEDCPSEYRDLIWYGAGPRAGISLVSVCKACALMEKSDIVRWKHIRRMATPVLRHRIRLNAKARGKAMSEDIMVERLLTQIEQKYSHLAKGVS